LLPQYPFPFLLCHTSPQLCSWLPWIKAVSSFSFLVARHGHVTKVWPIVWVEKWGIQHQGSTVKGTVVPFPWLPSGWDCDVMAFPFGLPGWVWHPGGSGVTKQS
jgi:hypothetical protein